MEKNLRATPTKRRVRRSSGVVAPKINLSEDEETIARRIAAYALQEINRQTKDYQKRMESTFDKIREMVIMSIGRDFFEVEVRMDRLDDAIRIEHAYTLHRVRVDEALVAVFSARYNADRAIQQGFIDDDTSIPVLDLTSMSFDSFSSITANPVTYSEFCSICEDRLRMLNRVKNEIVSASKDVTGMDVDVDMEVDGDGLSGTDFNF